MKKIIFKGCGTAIITPFNKEGELDLKSFGRLLDYQLENSVDAIIVCGTTGEASTMTLDEKKQTIEYAIKRVNGRVPVIAGTGANCTQTAIDMTKWAESAGADGALVVTPYYNKTTQAGLVAHYTAIANSTKLPIILYNVPGRTGVNIAPSTCKELSKIENIVAVKEASGNLSQIAEIKHLCQDELSIYSGNDDQIIPIMSIGGIGVISVLSHVMPKYTHDMIEEFNKGNVAKAAKMQVDCIPMCQALFCEVNPIPVKYACHLLGYGAGIPRLPLIELSDSGKERLVSTMKEFNII